MEIRRDFSAVETYLHRLCEIAKAFDELEDRDWVHMKNQEDFNKVYVLAYPERSMFELLYANGRSTAGFMRSHLREFNSAKLFPTLALYVDSFSKTWVASIEENHEWLEQVKVTCNKLDAGTPWSVWRMVELFEDQLNLLRAVRSTLDILKQSEMYRFDKGDFQMASAKTNGTVSIGVVNADRMYINSTDNSVNQKFAAAETFAELRGLLDAVVDINIRKQISENIDGMENNIGKPGFITHYKGFMQNAANHVAVFSPIFPALAQLLS